MVVRLDQSDPLLFGRSDSDGSLQGLDVLSSVVLHQRTDQSRFPALGRTVHDDQLRGFQTAIKFLDVGV